MSGNKTQSGFRLGFTMLTMLLVSLIILAIGWFALPKVFVDQNVHSCLLLAFGVVTGVSLLSLVPVGLLASQGLMPVVIAAFASVGLRLVVCLGVAIYANHALGMSKFPLVSSLMIFYLPLMGIEMAAISRFVWQKDSIAYPVGTRGQAAADSDAGAVKVAEVTA